MGITCILTYIFINLGVILPHFRGCEKNQINLSHKFTLKFTSTTYMFIFIEYNLGQQVRYIVHLYPTPKIMQWQ